MTHTPRSSNIYGFNPRVCGPPAELCRGQSLCLQTAMDWTIFLHLSSSFSFLSVEYNRTNSETVCILCIFVYIWALCVQNMDVHKKHRWFLYWPSQVLSHNSFVKVCSYWPLRVIFYQCRNGVSDLKMWLLCLSSAFSKYNQKRRGERDTEQQGCGTEWHHI